MPNIKQIQSLEPLNIALESGLYQTVDRCFSPPPFNEIVTPEKVNYYFQKYVNRGVLYLAYENSKPIGFTAALPLIETKDLCELSFLNTWVYYQKEKICLNTEFFTQTTQLSLHRLQYVADLGVDREFRRQGIARQLFQTLYSHFNSSVAYVLRTTNNPNYAYISKFYQNLGFQMLPAMEQINEKSQGNNIDDRILVGIKYPQESSHPCLP